METIPGSKPVPTKSNFNLLLILFISIIILSLCTLRYYQGERHEIAKVAEMESIVMPSTESMPIASAPASRYKTKTIRMAGHAFIAEVADTNELRQQGLSGRLSLGDNQAMVFVFPSDGQNLFWMKDMHFAIDMIWLDAKKKIVYMAKDAAPESYPKTFGPVIPTRYVIEVQAGIADKLGLEIGDSVSF